MDRPEIGQALSLVTASGDVLGTVQVEEFRGDWVIGILRPGAAYDLHRPLFVEWTRTLGDMAFSCLDGIDAQIGMLEISAASEGAILDCRKVQIYDDGRRATVALRCPV